MARNIFLSYSRDELEIAQKLRTRLERAGFRVWMDKTKLEIGAEWREEIKKAIHDSQAIVIALSPSAARSEYVTEEITIARGAHVHPFPLIIHGRPETAVPPMLVEYQHFDATDRKFDAGVKRLTESLYAYAAIRQPNKKWLKIAIGTTFVLLAVTAAVSLKLFSLATYHVPLFDVLTYVDFENQADLADWASGDTSSIAQSSAESFSGSYSLAVTTTSGAEDRQKVFWNRPLHANAIVGQVYWPEQSGIQLDWAQFCAWACVPIDVQTNQWNTFSMDVSELTFNDTPLSQLRIPQLWIQVQLSGPSPDLPYTFYVDGFQYYPSE
ncbi:MAG: toll/interleukin-1 receptor domain-containing protein [Anaerolinea sp.]|nr:toll/interleukin-1 receptor domain-containing protein [Anaerolinea sp.]